MRTDRFSKLTWKLCLILSGLKLLGITTTPLWTLKRRATWALLLLYFFPMETSSSSSSRGGHFTFTLNQGQREIPMTPGLYVIIPNPCKCGHWQMFISTANEAVLSGTKVVLLCQDFLFSHSCSMLYLKVGKNMPSVSFSFLQESQRSDTRSGHLFVLKCSVRAFSACNSPEK